MAAPTPDSPPPGGMPVKANDDSGGKANGVPEGSWTASERSDVGEVHCGGGVRLGSREDLCGGSPERSRGRSEAGIGCRGKGQRAPFPLPPRCRRPASLLFFSPWRMVFFAHEFSAHFDAVSIVHEPVEDAVGDSGVADLREGVHHRDKKAERSFLSSPP
jgi:hypothetical protein